MQGSNSMSKSGAAIASQLGTQVFKDTPKPNYSGTSTGYIPQQQRPITSTPQPDVKPSPLAVNKFVTELNVMKHQRGGIGARLIPDLVRGSAGLTTTEIVLLIVAFKRVGGMSGKEESWKTQWDMIRKLVGDEYLGNISPPMTAGLTEEQRNQIKTASAGRKTPAQATLDMVYEVGHVIKKWLIHSNLPEDTMVTAGTIAWALESHFKSYAVAVFLDSPHISRQAMAYPIGSTAGCKLQTVTTWAHWYIKLAIMLAGEIRDVFPYKKGPFDADPLETPNWGGRDELLKYWAGRKIPEADQTQAEEELRDIKWDTKPQVLSTAAKLQVLFLFSPRHILFCRDVRLALANRPNEGVTRDQALRVVTEYMQMIYGLESFLADAESGRRPTYIGALRSWNRLRNYFSTARTALFSGGRTTGGNPRQNAGVADELTLILSKSDFKAHDFIREQLAIQDDHKAKMRGRLETKQSQTFNTPEGQFQVSDKELADAALRADSV